MYIIVKYMHFGKRVILFIVVVLFLKGLGFGEVG